MSERSTSELRPAPVCVGYELCEWCVVRVVCGGYELCERCVWCELCVGYELCE